MFKQNNLEISEGELSDEVESGILLLKARMGLWGLVASATSFSDKSSKSMRVSDGRGLLDGSTDVVVGEAELVGQGLNQVRRGADGVIDDGVPSWSRHALLGSHRDEIELVDVLVSDGRVNDCSWKWVLVAAWISSEEPGVDSLAGVDVHERGG